MLGFDPEPKVKASSGAIAVEVPREDRGAVGLFALAFVCDLSCAAMGVEAFNLFVKTADGFSNLQGLSAVQKVSELAGCAAQLCGAAGLAVSAGALFNVGRSFLTVASEKEAAQKKAAGPTGSSIPSPIPAVRGIRDMTFGRISSYFQHLRL